MSKAELARQKISWQDEITRIERLRNVERLGWAEIGERYGRTAASMRGRYYQAKRVNDTCASTRGHAGDAASHSLAAAAPSE